MRKVLVRSGAVAAGALAAVLLAAAPASAHVTVNPSDATQGGFTKLTFRVPNEKDNAATTAVEVNLPQETPIAFVSIKPVAGWTANVTKSKLDKPIKSDDGEVTEAVTKIEWKSAAADTAIQAGQFQEFDVSAGPLPTTDQIQFKTLQTYSDGEVVRWIEDSADSKAEHPAPTLKLAKAPAEGSDTQTGTATGDDKSANAAGTTDTSAMSRANLGLGLGIAALVLAVIGLVLGFLAYRRRPTPTG
jgi:uncharacterized protein YcnI